MRYTLIFLILTALSLTGCSTLNSLSAYQKLPDNYRVLFWPQDRRDDAFVNAENLAETANIPAGIPSELREGSFIKLEKVDQYFKDQHLAGLLVLHKGEIVYEQYGRSLTHEKRWSSFSVAKSITSTLVGAAIKDGYIGSMDDLITQYIPELKESAYDAVTIRHLLTMTSGVKWDENYGNPNSDVAQFITHIPEKGIDLTVSYLQSLDRSAPPGDKFNYNTGETNLAGILVARATGKKLAEYLSEKIWVPYGMESDAIWVLDSSGTEIAGCCLSARLRDYGRFGQFIMDGAKVDGVSILPDGWLNSATSSQKNLNGRAGYGFFWWTSENGSYDARGIFGQRIAMVPSHNYLVVTLSNWPNANGSPDIWKSAIEMYNDITKALFSDNPDLK